VTTPALIHKQAMESAELALAARSRGDHERARRFFREAFDHERRAALQVIDDHAAEPTRSILLRSAAALALDCEETREAERLIALALSGDPPAEIAEELRDLLEQVGFSRHLETRGAAEQALAEIEARHHPLMLSNGQPYRDMNGQQRCDACGEWYPCQEVRAIRAARSRAAEPEAK
jgi:hypothetical protein